METKRADFAGSWYPATAMACEREILDFLDDSLIQTVPEKEYHAGIVPHAGWFFSGSVACHVIKTLRGDKAPDVIVLFGKHLRPRDPATIMVNGAMETPFGDIPIHEPLALALADSLALSIERATSATPENTIELQLPFIRYFFPDTTVVPMGIPPTSKAETLGREAVRNARDMGLRVKVIGSTDLTHYGPNYGFSPAGTGSKGVAWVKEENDKRMVDHLIAMDDSAVLSDALSTYNACCGGAATAAVCAARELGATRGELLAYTTSYDKRPDDSLVGYAGVVY